MTKTIYNDKTKNKTRLIVTDSTKTDGVKLRLSNRMERYDQPHGASNYIVLDKSQCRDLINELEELIEGDV